MPGCFIWGLWLTIAPLNINTCQHEMLEYSWRVFRSSINSVRQPNDKTMVKFIPPTAKLPKMSSGFGQRLHPLTGRLVKHNGVDFPMKVGTPIMVVADGIVVEQGRNRRAGNYITIRHADGWYSRYLHLSASFVQKGRKLLAGSRVGLSGNTGMSTGPHLHLEIGYRGVAVNPMRLFGYFAQSAKKSPVELMFNSAVDKPQIIIISYGPSGTKITVRRKNRTLTVSPGRRVFGEYTVIKQDNGRFRIIPDS